MLSFEGRPSLPPPPPSAMNYANLHAYKQINGALQEQHHRHMWIVTGPAGCGKSTVAEYLSQQLSIPYLEGDDYHSASNKDKMAHNIPLTDIDRWDWLIILREAAVRRLQRSSSSSTKPHDGVVVTCSALKRKYRDVIRIAAYEDHNVAVHFIYLRADEEVLMKRVQARKGHYMKNSMVHSQMEALEEPDSRERGRDVLEVDCAPSLTEVQKRVVQTVREALADDV
ncbi:hypothetical protein MMC09_001319 [Bachmanniomyces sp. S44760]|nr:hypothetical protein [Bachmanniomyces sp. S44760]